MTIDIIEDDEPAASRVKTEEMKPTSRGARLTIDLEHADELAGFLEHVAQILRSRRGPGKLTILIEE